MVNKYIGSEQHKHNALIGSNKAKEINKKNREDRKEKYELNPNKCANCRGVLPYNKLHNKFCSNRCSASFNNKKRNLSEVTKEKISNSILDFYANNPDFAKQKKYTPRYKTCTKIKNSVCAFCGKTFILPYSSDNKTCSKQCRTSYIITTRKSTSSKKSKFYNKWQNKEINLDSSWELELASWLNDADIEWIRPEPIKWFDDKQHLYFADFYLPKYNLYLDPKNKLVIELDKNKLEILINDVGINLVYGDVEYIINIVKNKYSECISSA